jgi:hypothetical protein
MAINTTAHFSTFNRFSLSFDYYQKVNEFSKDETRVIYFSLPLTVPIFADESNSLKLNVKDQSLQFAVGALGCLESWKDQYDKFGVLEGKSIYQSSFLNAYVNVSLFSTQNVKKNEIQDIEFERFLMGNKEDVISGVTDFKINLPYAYLELFYKNVSVSFGKEKLRWGPGYKGTLGLSGTAISPVYFYNLELTLGKVMHFQAFLNSFEDESLFTDEISGHNEIIINSNKQPITINIPRYGAGQRMDLRIGKHVQIGIYELVDFFGSSDLARFSNPLQIYYLGNNNSKTNNANVQAGVDFNLFINPIRLYGEFLNDDITVFEDAGNPNKYAWQIGAAYYGKKRIVEAGIEYTHVAPYVYGHYTALGRHEHWGESMGWPWGNDQDLFNGHMILTVNEKINALFEVNYWIKGEGTLKDDWYADKMPNLDNASYWPKYATRRISFTGGVLYQPLSWLEIMGYYEPAIENKKYSNSFNCYLRMEIPFRKELLLGK